MNKTLIFPINTQVFFKILFTSNTMMDIRFTLTLLNTYFIYLKADDVEFLDEEFLACTYPSWSTNRERTRGR